MSSLKMLTIDLRNKTLHTKLIHTVLYKNAPTYLTDLLHLKKCIRPLRNSNYKLLTLPPINRKQHGGRSFRYMAASTWNNLPDDIRKSTIYIYIEEAIYSNTTLRNMCIQLIYYNS